MRDVLLCRAHWIGLGLFSTSALALIVPSGYSFGYYILGIFGFILWLFNREALIDPDARMFVLPLMAYGLGQLLQGLNEQFSWRSLDPGMPFLFAVFALWLVRRYKPNVAWFWSGLAIGAIGAAVFSAYQVSTLGGRASGYMHPIQFGNIALLLGVLCLVRALITLEMTWANVLMWVGFASGLIASAWSQTRGGWVAILLIFFWILMHATKKWPWRRKIISVVILGMSIATLGVQLGLSKVIQSRVSDAINETVSFVESGNQDSPVGSRLAMWSFGLRHLADAPILGIGKQGWLKLRDQGIANGELSPVFISELTHLHNEYLDSFLKRGLIGLILLLVLYFIPMVLFFRPYLTADDIEIRSLAIAGMVIPMMYMDFGITQTFLSHNSGRIVLCSLWMCVAGLMLNAAEDN